MANNGNGELSFNSAQLTAIESNAADHAEATTKPKASRKPKIGLRTTENQKIRTELKDDEFHVAAVIDHWPYHWTAGHAQQYLLRWKEGIDDDS
jgi:hypothetical protein